MFIIGVDASMNGSGLVKFELDDNKKIISRDYLAFVPKRSLATDKIKAYLKKDFSNNFNQFRWMLKEILDFVPNDSTIAIEGYAMGAKGNVFDIGEWGGIIKYHLLEKGCKLRIYPPTMVKKYFTDNGTSDKVMMCNEYFKRGDILELAWLDKYKAPQADIVDAFAIATMMYDELITPDVITQFVKDNPKLKSLDVFESPLLCFTN